MGRHLSEDEEGRGGTIRGESEIEIRKRINQRRSITTFWELEIYKHGLQRVIIKILMFSAISQEHTPKFDSNCS